MKKEQTLCQSLITFEGCSTPFQSRLLRYKNAPKAVRKLGMSINPTDDRFDGLKALCKAPSPPNSASASEVFKKLGGAQTPLCSESVPSYKLSSAKGATIVIVPNNTAETKYTRTFLIVSTLRKSFRAT